MRDPLSLSVSVATQSYRVAVHEESVILGNDVIFHCNIQSYVTDFVSVSGWVDSEGFTVTRQDVWHGKLSLFGQTIGY